MRLIRTSEVLDPSGTWNIPLEDANQVSASDVQYFDQGGYDLTRLEQMYAQVNHTDTCKMRWRTAISKTWFEDELQSTPVHVNHAKLFERKGFTGAAREQLENLALSIPIVNKLIKIRPKWGMDISIDYADSDKVFEVFHYEWDDFDYDVVVQKQYEIEKILLDVDWNQFAERLWIMRDQWKDLNFLQQSEFRTQLLGIEPERFKMVPWAFDNS